MFVSAPVRRRLIRWSINCLPVVLAVVALSFGWRSGPPSAAAQSGETPAAPSQFGVFDADPASLGLIPDGTALGNPPNYGAPRNVTFNVAGMNGSITDVRISFTSGNPAHTFRGDLEAVLKAPGGSPSFLLFSRTGATSATSFGSNSDLTGPYNFTDSAAGPNWWAVTATPTTPGDYRTVGAGPSATNPAATNLSAAFASVPNPNGVWTLSFRDGTSADTGAISAASLTLTTNAVVNQHTVDFNGDGKTDFAVARNTGGGPNGQLTWFVNLNGSNTTFASAWGLNGDFPTPADFDGDQKTDIAVWRADGVTVAKFFILQSATNTVRSEAFGQTGDNPTVVGDYDGDGRADIAVYRPGVTRNAPSTWFYRGSLNNPDGLVTYVPWGIAGDLPSPGDYDGDGRADFVVQRAEAGGQTRFWMNQTTAGVTSIPFGTSGDTIVPGLYDADNRTDLAVVRAVGGQLQWFVRPSTTGVVSGAPAAIWGTATDLPAPGDYDGDGRTDFAVYRASPTAGQSAFWVFGGTSGAFSVPFGQNGDYPVANFNAH
ncbi:MAG: VCBS repeat-containing protein [Acidobacteria bacterium]|nr:VCBS repeat-containing protein [Acidobacteriota bacterium]